MKCNVVMDKSFYLLFNIIHTNNQFLINQMINLNMYFIITKYLLFNIIRTYFIIYGHNLIDKNTRDNKIKPDMNL